MLSESMVLELRYFVATIIFGFAVSVLYHLLLFFRAVVRHGISFVDAEDILFLCGVGFGFFYVVYRMNDGILRWYAFFGMLVGIVIYLRTMARLLEPVRKWLLQKRRKTFKIKAKQKNKDGESEVEGFTSKSKPKKAKKENRSADHSGSGDGVVRRNHVQQKFFAGREKRKRDSVQ